MQGRLNAMNLLQEQIFVVTKWARGANLASQPSCLEIPTKSAMHSKTKPATYSELKPAGVPI
jgi:hypothetical protein